MRQRAGYLPDEGEHTTLSAADLLALLRAEGLTPPADFPSPGDDACAWTWADWWEDHRSGWDEALVARLWNALDRVHFYEVLEVPLQP